MKKMNIRTVKPSDNEILAQLIRAVFDEHRAPQKGTVYSDPTTDELYQLFQTEKSILWVAELENQILGCCGIYPTKGLPENCTELVKYYLASNARGKGVGRELMEKSISSAREMGYSQIYIESLSAFSVAGDIYEKQGFKKKYRAHLAILDIQAVTFGC